MPADAFPPERQLLCDFHWTLVWFSGAWRARLEDEAQLLGRGQAGESGGKTKGRMPSNTGYCRGDNRLTSFNSQSTTWTPQYMSRRKGHVERSVKALDKLLQHTARWHRCGYSPSTSDANFQEPLSAFLYHSWQDIKKHKHITHTLVLTVQNSNFTLFLSEHLPQFTEHTFKAYTLWRRSFSFFFFSFLASVHRSMVVCYVLFIRDCHYCHKPSKTLMFFYSFHAALIKCAHKRPNRVHPFKGGMDHCLFLSLILY